MGAHIFIIRLLGPPQGVKPNFNFRQSFNEEVCLLCSELKAMYNIADFVEICL